jgi:tetratricopeptide (TPR) repeat protein
MATPKMMFVFGYLGTFSAPPGWPVRLMHVTEASFVTIALVCLFLAIRLRGSGTEPKRDAVAAIGGISAGFGLIMPFELAPFFFNARGELMMATILLIPVYPIAVILFSLGLRRFMRSDRPPDLRADLLSASRCYDRGVVHLDKKDYDHAIADFSEAIRYNPKFAAAYFNRGAAYFSTKDYDLVIADYDQVIALNPKLAEAYHNRGNAYRAKGELDRANTDFDQANALTQDEELRLHPRREVSGTGVMRVFSEWRNNRGC